MLIRYGHGLGYIWPWGLIPTNAWKSKWVEVAKLQHELPTVLAGATPEVNLRNQLCSGHKQVALKPRVDVIRIPKQGHLQSNRKD